MVSNTTKEEEKKLLEQQKRYFKKKQEKRNEFNQFWKVDKKTKHNKNQRKIKLNRGGVFIETTWDDYFGKNKKPVIRKKHTSTVGVDLNPNSNKEKL